MPDYYSPDALSLTHAQLRLISQGCSLNQACKRLQTLYLQRGIDTDPLDLLSKGQYGIKAIYNRLIGTALPGLAHKNIQKLSDKQYLDLFNLSSTVGLDKPIIFNDRPYIDFELFLTIYLGRGYSVYTANYKSYGLSNQQYNIALAKFIALTNCNQITKTNFNILTEKYALDFNYQMRTQFSITLKDLSLVELYRVLHTPNQQVSSFAQEMKISVSDLNTYIRFHTDLTTEQFLQAQVDEISEQMLIRHAVSGYRKNLNLEPKQIFTPVYFSLRDFLEQCLDKKTPYTLTYLQIYVIAKALEMRIINPGISINIDSLGLIAQTADTCTIETLKDTFTHISSKAITHREGFIHYYDKDFIEIAKEFLSGISALNPIASSTLSTVDKADNRNNLPLSKFVVEGSNNVPSLIAGDSKDNCIELSSDEEMGVEDENYKVTNLPLISNLFSQNNPVGFFGIAPNKGINEQKKDDLSKFSTILDHDISNFSNLY